MRIRTLCPEYGGAPIQIMMDKVADYYQVLHKNLIKQMQSLLEPIMIGFLAFIVGIILLAVVMPMFDIYSKIR